MLFLCKFAYTKDTRRDTINVQIYIKEGKVMKKGIVLILLIFCVAGIFSQDHDSNGTNIVFSGLAFSNITSVDSGNTKNEQLFGWTTSTIRERSWGDTYSKFGILYNFSAQSTNGVIGIPFPAGEKILDLDTDALYFPTRQGYAFRPQIAENTEVVLIPSLGVSFFWNDVEYNTDNGNDKTKYSGYLLGVDLSLAFDVSMMHSFSNTYVRYGIELNVPMFQLSASRMKKEISQDGFYYDKPLRAESNDFISLVDIFKLEASPYIAIGIKFKSKRPDWYYEPEIETVAIQ